MVGTGWACSINSDSVPFLPVGGVGADWIDPFGDGGGIDNWGDILVFEVYPHVQILTGVYPWTVHGGPWLAMVDHGGP